MLHDRAVRHLLSDVAVFSGCGARELRRVDQASVEWHVEPGRVMCREGAAGRECFVIVAGEAAVTVAGVEIARLGGGSFFGEMAVLDGGPRTATVAAITAMDLLVFTSGEFHALLRDVPTVLRNVVTTMTSRLRLADRAMVTARQDATPLPPGSAN